MNIVLIGTGKVGSSLARALHGSGHNIQQLINRHPESALPLAKELSCSFACHPSLADGDADLYLLCVKDDAIATVCSQLREAIGEDHLVAHTSGSAPLDWIDRHFRRSGIFYPLQTFTTDTLPDLQEVPLLVSSRDADVSGELSRLAASICRQVYRIDDSKLPSVHVAAVFANNFVNRILGVSREILLREGLPFPILEPLAKETIRKAFVADPTNIQTGPARRGDLQTLHRHLEYLRGYPESYSEAYALLSRMINPEIKL